MGANGVPEYTVLCTFFYYLYQMKACRGMALVWRYPALANAVRSPGSCDDDGLMCPFCFYTGINGLDVFLFVFEVFFFPFKIGQAKKPLS